MFCRSATRSNLFAWFIQESWTKSKIAQLILVGYSATTHIQTHNKQALKHKTKTPKRETGKSWKKHTHTTHFNNTSTSNKYKDKHTQLIIFLRKKKHTYNYFLYFCGLKCNVEMSKENSIIEHTGVVATKTGNKLLINITQMAACSGCHAKEACTAADKAEKQIEAICTDNSIQIGDKVMIYGQRQLGMKAVGIAFVIPFVLVLAVIALLQHTSLSEPASGSIALGTLVPYYIVLSFFRDKLKRTFLFYARKQESN